MADIVGLSIAGLLLHKLGAQKTQKMDITNIVDIPMAYVNALGYTSITSIISQYAVEDFCANNICDSRWYDYLDGYPVFPYSAHQDVLDFGF